MIHRGLIPRRVNESYNVRLRSDNLLCGEYVAVSAPPLNATRILLSDENR